MPNAYDHNDMYSKCNGMLFRVKLLKYTTTGADIPVASPVLSDSDSESMCPASMRDDQQPACTKVGQKGLLCVQVQTSSVSETKKSFLTSAPDASRCRVPCVDWLSTCASSAEWRFWICNFWVMKLKYYHTGSNRISWIRSVTTPMFSWNEKNNIHVRWLLGNSAARMPEKDLYEGVP